MENKIIQSLGIPYTALISIIFLLMISSFPIGAYVVFNSEINDNITYEYPIGNLESILSEIGIESSMKFELGDGFMVNLPDFIYYSSTWTKKTFHTSITINNFSRQI